MLQDLDQGRHQMTIEDTTARRRRFLDQKVRPEGLDPVGAVFRLDRPVDGWEGTPVELWRFDGASIWWEGLFNRSSSAYLDWLGPWLELEVIRQDQASWTHMWLHELDVVAMSRVWIRSAFGLIQSARSVGSGSPIDNQISGYLLDCDSFATADKVFASIAEQVRSLAPFPMADSHLLPAGSATGPALIAMLNGHPEDSTSP